MNERIKQEFVNWGASSVSAPLPFITFVQESVKDRKPVSMMYSRFVQTITSMEGMEWHFTLARKSGKTLLVQKLSCLNR
jgi:hypothetical protein